METLDNKKEALMNNKMENNMYNFICDESAGLLFEEEFNFDEFSKYKNEATKVEFKNEIIYIKGISNWKRQYYCSNYETLKEFVFEKYLVDILGYLNEIHNRYFEYIKYKELKYINLTRYIQGTLMYFDVKISSVKCIVNLLFLMDKDMFVDKFTEFEKKNIEILDTFYKCIEECRISKIS